MNTITNEPLLKRQARIRPRKNTLVSCSNPLSVIEEEDSGNLSSSSSSSSKPSCSNSRHDSRAALLKSARRRANIISDPVDPFSVTFTQVTYPFPHPPLPTPNSFPPALSCPSSPSSSSSASSSPISSPYSHTSSLPTSPESGPCSYDEDDIPLLSCTRPLVISKRTAEEEYDLIDRDLEEEYHYYSQEFNKIISLASLYEETTRFQSRPESVFTAPLHSPSPCIIPPRPVTPPSPRRNRPASLNIVRPPPRTSLPVPADLDSEESANVLMYYLDSPSSSSLSSGSVYSTYSDDHEADDRLSLVDFEFEMDQSVRLRFPLSVPCSPIDLEADIREGLEELHARSEVADVEVERTSTPSGSDAAPSAATWSFDEELEHEQKEMEVGRTLRSKWSTSTLGSVKEPKSAKSRVLLFSPKKMKGFSFRGSTGGSPTKPLPEAKVPETPYSMLFSPTSSHFSGRKEGALRRRSSTSTNGSSTDSEYSGCSEGSSGLRRKPIPIELFMKT